MTEVKTDAAVRIIVDRGTAAASLASLMLLAADMLKPGANWNGRKKLEREEALAATRAVTSMLRRYDLKPTKVLLKAGRASEPGATSRFYLTAKEMEPDAVVTKRLTTGLAAHLDNVRSVVRHAREAGHEVDEGALLAELAEAVAPFLEQFREEVDYDVDSELARDVGLIAAWISDPRRGFELARFLFEATRQDLCFDAAAGEMDYHGEAATVHDGNTPVIPLLTRIVARADAEIFVADPDAVEPEKQERNSRLSQGQNLRSAGRSHCIICQKVGLGVAPDPERKGSLCMVFTLDPVTYLGWPVEGGGEASWMHRRYSETLEVPWIPVPGRREPTGDGTHWFATEWPKDYLCPEYKAFIGEVYHDEHGWDPMPLWSRRWLPITSDTCALILDEDNRRTVEAWRSLGNLVEKSVIPTIAVTDTGVESQLIRDRFAALLYASEESSAAGLLLKEAERRAEALERFTVRTATGERRRKLAFRARMRK